MSDHSAGEATPRQDQGSEIRNDINKVIGAMGMRLTRDEFNHLHRLITKYGEAKRDEGAALSLSAGAGKDRS